MQLPPSKNWKLTWGAIAVDVTTGDIGTAVGKPYQEAASQEAMVQCAKHRANACTLSLTYVHQCAVLAWPSVVGGTVVVQGGPTIEKASEIVLSSCKEAAGSECKIAYADCTQSMLETH